MHISQSPRSTFLVIILWSIDVRNLELSLDEDIITKVSDDLDLVFLLSTLTLLSPLPSERE